MTWSKRDLDEAIAAYQRALVASGRTPGTITTYVGDARRFVEWLAGERRLHGRSLKAAAASRPTAGPTPQAMSVPAARALPALRVLLRRWQAAGSPRQAPIPWPRDRWMGTIPRHATLLRRLPDRLDRAAVRRIAARAAGSEDASEAAFLSTMVWGFGSVGYGPHRTATMLGREGTRRCLHAVAVAARDGSALEAYRRFSTDCRIKGLGPAFGTKFIAFCQPSGRRPSALIHDELVGSWLTAHGCRDLASSAWSPSTYAAYLIQMEAWADELGVSSETIEYLIFQSMADARGGQWATSAK